MELRTLATGSDMVATATAVSATVGSSGRDTIRAAPPLADLPDPLHTPTTFVVLASPALAADGDSAAAVSADVPAVADSVGLAEEGSMEVAADSMAAAVAVADTARTTRPHLFAARKESIPEGYADSVFHASFCDGFRSYTG